MVWINGIELKETMNIQRNAKEALTGCGKKLTSVRDVDRPEGEVRDALNEVKEAIEWRSMKNRPKLTIEDDEQNEEAEN